VLIALYFYYTLTVLSDIYIFYTFEHLKRRFLSLYYINEINFIKKTNYYVYRNGYYWYAIQSYEHFSI